MTVSMRSCLSAVIITALATVTSAEQPGHTTHQPGKPVQADTDTRQTTTPGQTDQATDEQHTSSFTPENIDVLRRRNLHNAMKQARMRRQNITDQEIKDILAVLRDLNPTMAERLHRALMQNREQARRMLAMARDRVKEMVEARRNDPELYKLRVQDFRLTQRTRMVARRARQADLDGNQRDARRLIVELKNIIREHFDVRQTMREHELHRLELRLDAMRKQLQQRAESREQLIQKRIDEVLGDGEQPQW